MPTRPRKWSHKCSRCRKHVKYLWQRDPCGRAMWCRACMRRIGVAIISPDLRMPQKRLWYAGALPVVVNGVEMEEARETWQREDRQCPMML